jgi:hypothetical protein
MRTQLMIMMIVGAVFLVAIAIVVGLVVWLGWLGGLVAALVTFGVLVGLYVWVIKPWHLRWGATADEVAGAMPGDELIPDAGSATRAVSIAAKPNDVWPWLVQIGYGKAGWYSYDWIDNDFEPSADQILPEYQDLAVGDKILMMPDMGFVVESIDEDRSIVSVLEDGSTSWCLALYPTDGGGTRLVSRWRPKFDVTPATVMMTALAEPGTFIMEQKMLRTIRDRVEASSANPPSTDEQPFHHG